MEGFNGGRGPGQGSVRQRTPPDCRQDWTNHRKDASRNQRRAGSGEKQNNTRLHRLTNAKDYGSRSVAMIQRIEDTECCRSPRVKENGVYPYIGARQDAEPREETSLKSKNTMRTPYARSLLSCTKPEKKTWNSKQQPVPSRFCAARHPISSENGQNENDTSYK